MKHFSVVLAATCFALSASPSFALTFTSTADLRGVCGSEGNNELMQTCVGYLIAGLETAVFMDLACPPPRLTNNALVFLFMVGSEQEIARRPDAAELPALEMMLGILGAEFECGTD